MTNEQDTTYTVEIGEDETMRDLPALMAWRYAMMADCTKRSYVVYSAAGDCVAAGRGSPDEVDAKAFAAFKAQMGREYEAELQNPQKQGQ